MEGKGDGGASCDAVSVAPSSLTKMRIAILDALMDLGSGLARGGLNATLERWA